MKVKLNDVLKREKQNSDYYDNKWTSKGKPWALFLSIICSNKKQAQAIESHIKKMKSKIYILNLKNYPKTFSN